jgi:hypothetical protein
LQDWQALEARMAVFKIELNQEIYEKLVALALDEWRPPLMHVEWILHKAIQEAYAARERVAEHEAPITAEARAGV